MTPGPRSSADPDATLSDGYGGDLLIGYAIENRYRVERLLGEGGMGRVYEVTDLVLQRRMVLKTLLPHLSEDPTLLQRFLREARAAASVGSAHVVSAIDVGTLMDGRSYYVMEHVDGVDLETTLNELTAPMEPRRALEIARGVTRAVAAAHAAGVIHRDIKPDNVVLCVRGGRADFVKLLDFGLARVTTDDTRLTMGGELVGTPHYMAPEQCSDGAVDARADLYAIGVLLYEMLTLELPFDAEAFAEVLRLKIMTTAVPPSERPRCGHISVEVEDLVMRLMQKDPAARFESADDLLRALEGILGPESSGAYALDISGEEPTLYRAPPPVVAPATPIAPTPSAKPSAKPARSALPILAIAAFAIALLATAIGSAAIGWIVAHPRDVTAASAD
ncbi:MAG: serine/threonine protein kinase [Sandaracinaceae bacterium]|nr:serine/threonine protein kinase [Sandaracinaceae bacterium]